MEINISNCDFWGQYRGYKIYRCYSKKAPEDYPQIVFALGSDLWMNGVKVGKVTTNGEVFDWHPERAEKKSKKKEISDDTEKKLDISNAEEILANSWKRTVDQLIGDKYSSEYKYSE